CRARPFVVAVGGRRRAGRGRRARRLLPRRRGGVPRRRRAGGRAPEERRAPIRPRLVVVAARPGVAHARVARGLGPRRGLTVSIPQPLQVPPPRPAVLVQVEHHPAARLDPPVLTLAAVLPPPALDPPPADHVADLVPASPPDERRRHPPIALHRHPVLVELAHRHPPAP